MEAMEVGGEVVMGGWVSVRLEGGEQCLRIELRLEISTLRLVWVSSFASCEIPRDTREIHARFK